MSVNRPNDQHSDEGRGRARRLSDSRETEADERSAAALGESLRRAFATAHGEVVPERRAAREAVLAEARSTFSAPADSAHLQPWRLNAWWWGGGAAAALIAIAVATPLFMPGNGRPSLAANDISPDLAPEGDAALADQPAADQSRVGDFNADGTTDVLDVLWLARREAIRPNAEASDADASHAARRDAEALLTQIVAIARGGGGA